MRKRNFGEVGAQFESVFFPLMLSHLQPLFRALQNDCRLQFLRTEYVNLKYINGLFVAGMKNMKVTDDSDFMKEKRGEKEECVAL